MLFRITNEQNTIQKIFFNSSLSTENPQTIPNSDLNYMKISSLTAEQIKILFSERNLINDKVDSIQILLKMISCFINQISIKGFFERSTDLMKNFSILFLRLNCLHKFLQLHTFLPQLQYFQPITDYITNIVQSLNQNTCPIKKQKTEETRKSIYHRQSIAKREKMSSIIQNLMLCFDAQNFLKQTQIHLSFNLYLIKLLTMKKFNEAFLQQKLFCLSDVIQVNLKDIEKVEQFISMIFFFSKLPSKDVQRLIIQKSPQEITFEINDLCQIDSSLMEYVVPMVIIGGTHKIDQISRELSIDHLKNCMRFLENWMIVLANQKENDYELLKQNLYFLILLKFQITDLTTKHEELFYRSHQDLSMLVFFKNCFYAGFQADVRFEIQRLTIPNWVDRLFPYQRKVKLVEVLDELNYVNLINQEYFETQKEIYSLKQSINQSIQYLKELNRNIVCLTLLEYNGEKFLSFSKFISKDNIYLNFLIDATTFKDQLIQFYQVLDESMQLLKNSEEKNTESQKITKKRLNADRILQRQFQQLENELQFLPVLLAVQPPINFVNQLNDKLQRLNQSESSFNFSYYLACCIIANMKPHFTYFDQDSFCQKTSNSELQRTIQLLQEQYIGQFKSEDSIQFLLINPILQQVPWEHLVKVEDIGTCFNRIVGIQHFLSLKRNNSQGLYYLVNPSNDLQKTEKRLAPFLQNIDGAFGKIGQQPSQIELLQVMAQPLIYLYVGHGAGQLYLSEKDIQIASQRILFKSQVYLLGCSSANLLELDQFSKISNFVEKEYKLERCDPLGISLDYMIGGAPLLCGSLYTITDKDIDKITIKLLEEYELFRKTNVEKHLKNSKKYLINKQFIIKYLSIQIYQWQCLHTLWKQLD